MSKKDWHKADIIAAVRRTGTTLKALSTSNGLCSSACQTALHRPYQKPEKIISDAIGVPGQEIWPSRYDSQGKRLPFLHSKILARGPKKRTEKPEESKACYFRKQENAHKGGQRDE